MAEYGPGLRRFFSRRAGPNDADDLVQEVFLRLQARAEGDPVENVEGYLFKIARNVLISRIREQHAFGGGQVDQLDDDFVSLDDLSPERILIGKQALESALVAILGLPPRARAAFLFHRFDNMTYQAIAGRMGISKESVKELMQRAIDRLSEELEYGRGS
ncbi:MAG TPA: sigma-70 family RNA polymerase sigma factor [Caulobacteraceae bacterium]|nr:sigma-70 family RNA polymerase sigma factor [Caulobacteraceae bacterium]